MICLLFFGNQISFSPFHCRFKVIANGFQGYPRNKALVPDTVAAVPTAVPSAVPDDSG